MAKGGGKKGAEDKEKGGKSDSRICWNCGKAQHCAQKAATTTCMPSFRRRTTSVKNM